MVRPGRVPKKKIWYNQKKSQNHNISPVWGEAPAEQIEMKICIGVDLGDVIMDVKFKFEKFQGFLCHWGKIRPFPLTLHVGLTTVPVNISIPSHFCGLLLLCLLFLPLPLINAR